MRAAGTTSLAARLAALCVLGALLGDVLGAMPSAAQDRQQDLEELRGAIDDTRERVGSHERHERALLEEIEDLDKRLAELATRVRRARKQEAHWRGESTRLEADRSRLEVRLRATREVLKTRARALYKSGAVGPLRALFVADSIGDWLRRVASLRTLVGYDRDLVVRIQSERSEVAVAQEDAQAARARHDGAARELTTARASLRTQRRARADLLAGVSSDRTRARTLLVELERAARALEATIETLGTGQSGESGALDAAGFVALRGRLPLPVKAPIGRSFGRVVDDEFRTETFNKGVEFSARAGDRVRAAADGQVRFAGWFRGYGRIVIIDHGGGYFTVSGHLAELEVVVGDDVDAGDTVGTVGETGSLSGPKLYFEVRRGSEPLDPEEWFGSS